LVQAALPFGAVNPFGGVNPFGSVIPFGGSNPFGSVIPFGGSTVIPPGPGLLLMVPSGPDIEDPPGPFETEPRRGFLAATLPSGPISRDGPKFGEFSDACQGAIVIVGTASSCATGLGGGLPTGLPIGLASTDRAKLMAMKSWRYILERWNTFETNMMFCYWLSRSFWKLEEMNSAQLDPNTAFLYIISQIIRRHVKTSMSPIYDTSESQN
jgi:hypothetical protein